MTGPRRYHPLYALGFMRKTLLLYLLPLIQVLFERDWPTLRAALLQDLALFAVLAAVSAAILYFSSWELAADGLLHLRWNFIIQQDRVYQGEELAALAIERTFFCRLTGASRVTLYPAELGSGRTATLTLGKKDAEMLADSLMSAPPQEEYHPIGGERLALCMLSVNGLSTAVLAFLALRQTRSYHLPTDLEHAAYAQLGQAAAFAARWLPTGVAWLVTLLVFIFGLSLVRSFGHTVRYRVWRGGRVLASRGGFITRTERRFRLDRLSCAEVRLSPLARLIGRYPVYITAGCYAGEDPVFVCRAGQVQDIERLLPGFRMPPVRCWPAKGRSKAFFLPAGAPFAIFALLAAASLGVLPGITWILVLPMLIFAAQLVSTAEGFLKEGAWPQDGRLTLVRQQGVSLRCICCFYPRATISLSQTPWAAAVNRCNLTVAFPGGMRRKVRSIPWAAAMRCTDLLEKENSTKTPERTPLDDKNDTL